MSTLRLARAISKQNALVATEDDDVFLLDMSSDEPFKLKALCQQKIESFACCGGRFAALSEDGRLFTWELELEGWKRLEHGGFGWVRNHDPVTKLVEGELTDKKVVQVACGRYHTLSRTEQGQLFLAINGNERISDLPKKLSGRSIDDNNAVHVACTSFRSHVLLENGQLYGWDLDTIDESGIVSCSTVRIDRKIGETVKQLVCGTFHCLALTDSGRVYAWGSNVEGQLGTGDLTRLPAQVESQYGKAVQVAAFGHRSAVKFADGSVRAFGQIEGRGRARGRTICYANIDEAFAPGPMWRTIDLSTALVPENDA